MVAKAQSVTVRRAEACDAGNIAALLAGSVRSEMAPLLIYGCDGIAEFIKAQIRYGSVSDTTYFVACKAEHVIGALELRKVFGRLFVNYIAVAPDCRGQGIGTVLLRDAMLGCSEEISEVALDVFEDNHSALRWYKRLGLQVTEWTEYLECVDFVPQAEERAVHLSDLPQADACHERFGFSQFRVRVKDEVFVVGRLGRKWFRLTEIRSLKRCVFSALHSLDPGRRVFAVVRGCSAPTGLPGQLLGRSVRMSGDVAVVRSTLEEFCARVRRASS